MNKNQDLVEMEVKMSFMVTGIALFLAVIAIVSATESKFFLLFISSVVIKVSNRQGKTTCIVLDCFC